MELIKNKYMLHNHICYEYTGGGKNDRGNYIDIFHYRTHKEAIQKIKQIQKILEVKDNEI